MNDPLVHAPWYHGPWQSGPLRYDLLPREPRLEVELDHHSRTHIRLGLGQCNLGWLHGPYDDHGVERDPLRDGGGLDGDLNGP